MATPADFLAVSLSYADWLAQQQHPTTTLQADFDDGSSVVFSAVTHETAIVNATAFAPSAEEAHRFD